MRIVIQRVSKAQVLVEEEIVGAIGKGLLVFLGIAENDTEEDIEWLVHKLVHLRIFNDENEVMNQALLAIDGELLIISQFTLMAATKKGHRPSYIKAANHEVAIPLYETFISRAEALLGKPVARGVFGADMDVQLHNDGPVTLIIDSKARA